MAPTPFLSLPIATLTAFLIISWTNGAESFALRPIGGVILPTPRNGRVRHVHKNAAIDGGEAGYPDDNVASAAEVSSRRGALTAIASGVFASLFAATGAATEASASEGARVIGQISGSGLVFKDTLNVETFDDPKVKGVTLYVSNFERPLNERLKKDFFTDPSSASVTCVRTGKEIVIADNINKDKGGEPVFEEKRSLLFKELRVQRLYDAEKNTIVYVSFNTRLDKSTDTNKSRFKSSICAINLD